MTAIAAPVVRGHHLPREIPLGLATATVLTEIANPLASGHVLAMLTVVTVLLFGAATTTQLLIGRGWRDCLRMLVITIGVGFAAEAVGVHTGVPFGNYHYTHMLGVELLGVPLIIPLAWTMMAWPALCVGRRLGAPVLVGGLALSSWDLFLDPQMVHDGYWVWSGPAPRLNGIPLVNHLGWLLVAILLMAALNRGVPTLAHDDDALPLGLWLWTIVSSVLANLVFFQRPTVALAGGVAMGVVALPLARQLRSRQHRSRNLFNRHPLPRP